MPVYRLSVWFDPHTYVGYGDVDGMDVVNAVSDMLHHSLDVDKIDYTHIELIEEPIPLAANHHDWLTTTHGGSITSRAHP